MLRGAAIYNQVFLAVLFTLLTTLNMASARTVGNACDATIFGGNPGHATLRAALQDAVLQGGGGLGNPMWATVVDTSGNVCDVAFSGHVVSDQWRLSRVISAQKANTAGGLSKQAGSGGTEIALSTANLWAAVQPGGSLFGLQHSNPVDSSVAYGGNETNWGTSRDPMRGQKIGGVNVFGGGLALYNAEGALVGGLGVSGDTSCADHNIAWRVRAALGLDHVPAGVGPNGKDGMIYDSDAAFGHPECGLDEKAVSIEIGAGG